MADRHPLRRGDPAAGLSQSSLSEEAGDSVTLDPASLLRLVGCGEPPANPTLQVLYRFVIWSMQAVVSSLVNPSNTSADLGPVRTCIGCRRREAKNQLLRVCAGLDSHDNVVVIPDPAGTKPGRGAHLHPTAACYELAVRRKAMPRALRLDHGPPVDAVGEYVNALTVNPPTRNRSSSS